MAVDPQTLLDDVGPASLVEMGTLVADLGPRHILEGAPFGTGSSSTSPACASRTSGCARG